MMLGCVTSMPRGFVTLCYHVTGITDLTLTFRYYVALNDQLNVSLCYCVAVGAEIVLHVVRMLPY